MKRQFRALDEEKNTEPVKKKSKTRIDFGRSCASLHEREKKKELKSNARVSIFFIIVASKNKTSNRAVYLDSLLYFLR